MDWKRLGSYTFLGADAQQWIVAAVAAVVTYLILTIGLMLVLKRLQAIASKSNNHVDDAVVTVLSSSNRFLFAVMSLLVGLGLLDLAQPWQGRVEQLWFIALALQLGLWGSKAISLFLARYIARHTAQNAAHTSAAATLMSWGMRTFLWAVVILSILANLGVNITAFVASLGVGGIAVALAVQNILGDLFASLSIAIDKPFEVGDFIVVNDVAGTIEFVGLKSTRIRSLGGEQIVMSNTDLLKQTISNYKRLQERRIVYTFGITYDATPAQAEEVPRIVKRVIESSSKLRFDRAHLLSFGESSLDYEVVFLVLDPDYNVYMDERQALNLKLMAEFDAIGVQFAFPTRTVHLASMPKTPKDAAPAVQTSPDAPASA
jgi:small-conductance mechanosensitive channel